MDGDAGWPEEYTQWWFDFLTQKGGKGVSKDTWVMVCVPLPFVVRASAPTPTAPWGSAGFSARPPNNVLIYCIVPRVRALDRRLVRELRHGRCATPFLSLLSQPSPYIT